MMTLPYNPEVEKVNKERSRRYAVEKAYDVAVAVLAKEVAGISPFDHESAAVREELRQILSDLTQRACDARSQKGE